MLNKNIIITHYIRKLVQIMNKIKFNTKQILYLLFFAIKNCTEILIDKT